ncbi:hypothetical protein ABH931_000263 [Streptacidiphilus sp. MAP12-33]|uniref:hypothetical protein n=1 Tax=Streptacidiphilus sp. MAP12-33 TaxID=3156266 RepID=UPI0035111BF4
MVHVDGGLDPEAARSRLERAVAAVAQAFCGETAAADETNCACHWGSAEELALLKRPGLPLGSDLLFRTWWEPGWRDHPAVLRRILPEFAAALAAGGVAAFWLAEAGGSVARGRWQRWPVAQAEAVAEFLRAWWWACLVCPEETAPMSEVLAACVEASGEIRSWLVMWDAATAGGPPTRRSVAEVARAWQDELPHADLPWSSLLEAEVEEALSAELSAWLRCRAPAVLWDRDEEGSPG